MKRIYRPYLVAAVVISIVVVFAVCWHSLGEIHYLKTFFPPRFSVQDACYAAVVELVKVLIIALPFCLLIGVALHLLRQSDQ